MYERDGVRFGINICYDTQFPKAAASVAAGGAQVLLVPAQNMMRRALHGVLLIRLPATVLQESAATHNGRT